MVKRNAGKGFSIVIAFLMMWAGIMSQTSASASEKEKQEETKIKNVIFLIGDGMGPAYTTAYRYVKDDPDTPEMEPTAFDPYLVGMQKVHPNDPKENITDSAAAGTAMSSGVKTYNGAVAVDNDKSEVKTVLEEAKEQGMATGLVATSQINHATPAAFGSHNESRNNYNEIADHYFDLTVDGKHLVDVMLGGGTKYFERDDRNLVKEFKQDGYSYVTNKQALKQDDNEQVLGLFAEVGLPKMKDRTKDIPSLEDMTKSAIDRLDNNNEGFFLMVEGSQIDWAGHANDVVGAMSEMEDFENAFQAAIAYAKQDKHTLVVSTADHSTGGLSIAKGGPYTFNPEAIRGVKRTPEFMAEQIENGSDVKKVLQKYVEYDLKKEEIEQVEEAKVDLKDNKDAVSTAISNVFNERARAGWTTDGHTGVDVQVYAYGPGKHMFTGMTDNTDQAKSIFKIIKNKAAEKEKEDDQEEDEEAEKTGMIQSIKNSFLSLADSVGGLLSSN
ncbi:alkaline phosphatase [Pontibacillus salicampi]|uniref:Alkaline phosphatase n=1 Tax=Pontibacillus salicampi TaxID=1449801 RepID=A0ABV6LUF4_9BACI